ncbi:MAG: PQQ-binding-like beta-propeller repeat protein, partial [Planctomycetes bacterium]|nr:PQQ-binding-like beta-propeller repeat protein [Planctomycetota bacterium]
MNQLPRFGLVIAGLITFLGIAPAADWPMWRFDANRSAASPQELPAKLHLQWVRSYVPLKPAWPEQPLLPFDSGYEPIVLGKIMYLGSSRTDSLTAIDTRTGHEVWRFHADGPIRFAPVAWEAKIYFVSDDGYLYCLDAAKGTLLWKFRGGPNDRKILGNERLISMWPARGGPVIADGTIYFAASIWPFMGIFIHAIDAKTGTAIWTNDGDGSIYIKQPHQTDSFAGVAPQGPLAVVGDKLIVPSGRSVPACYDRKTGKLLHFLLADNSKKGGGSDVAAIGPVFLNGGAAFEMKSGKYMGSFVTEPVLTDDVIYGFSGTACRAYDLKNAEITPPRWKIEDTGSFDIKGGTALIKAGSRLYVGAKDKLFSVALPLPKTTWPEVTWEYPLQGTPATILAADDRLFVVTLEGRIFCFGKESTEPILHPMEVVAPKNDQWTKTAIGILDATQVREGYCICWGVGSGRLVTALARRSKLHIIAIEKDAAKVDAVRDMLIAAGLYGERVAIIQADPRSVILPPYLASLMVSEDLAAAGVPLNDEFFRKSFQVLRPYGGTMCLSIPEEKEKEFAQVVVNAKLIKGALKPSTAGSLLIREGSLPGADNWTHEHADAANTRVSTDDLVKAPLGLLWFGGPPNEGILPRHGHGPQPQVVDGRLIIEGVDMLRAIDIYTGRLLWEAPLPGVGLFFNNTAHQPGANAAGTNYISTPDAIFVAYRNGCVKLDPATGKRIGEFKMPEIGAKKTTPRWGYINVVDEYLIGGADPLYDPKIDAVLQQLANAKISDDDPAPKKTTLKLPSIKLSDNDSLSASKHLVVMDRQTGKVLWTASARYGFRHNGICAGGGRLYAIVTGEWRLKQMYVWFYFPIAGTFWLLGALGLLPRVKSSTKGEG